jgi:polysaccharide biosynthesis transport protein
MTSRGLKNTAVLRMLHFNKQSASDETGQGIWGPSSAESISNLIRIIRHQAPTVIVSMALTTALGLVHLFTTPPTYLATASVVIDTHKAQSYEQQQPTQTESAIDAGLIQTQIEILKSAEIARLVVAKLRLTDDPEFVGPGTGPESAISKLISAFFGATAKPSDTELMRIAVANLAGKRTITRAGQTYMIEIGVESLDANKAARIVNTIVDAYLNDELEAKYAAARRATVWLQERAKELESEASAARRAVVEFKTKNNIVIVNASDGRLKAGEGRLMNEQQLSEVDSQLVLAQAATAEAKARYDRIREIMTQGLPDASVAEALKSEVIIKLRGQYLDLAAREGLYSQRYGPDHLASANLRSQMHEILRSIKDEMQKIEESAKSDYEIAQTRERSMRESLSRAVSQLQMTDQARIQLEDLESAAQTAKTLYDNFLERQMQAIQQQSFPIPEARLIDPAEPPLSKNHPKTFPVLLLTAATGFVVSFGAAFLRELSDRVFRSSGQVEEILLVKCLALLPKLRAAASPKAATWLHTRTSRLPRIFDESISQMRNALRFAKLFLQVKCLGVPVDLHAAVRTAAANGSIMSSGKRSRSSTKPPKGSSKEVSKEATSSRPPERSARRATTAMPKGSTLSSSDAAQRDTRAWPAFPPVVGRPPRLSHVLDEPFSQFAEALRSIKVASNLRADQESLKVIAVTSTLPHEGKSTVAASYAQLIAQGGCSTILIDADLRNPSLSRELIPDGLGLIDVIAGRKAIDDVVIVDRRTGLQLLLSGTKGNMLNTNDLLSSPGMKKVIDQLRDRFDYIIIDLPPLIPIVDARATANFVDAYIYVVEWGRTRIDTVKHSLANAPELYERLLGVVMNKVEMTQLRRYERHLGNYYYGKYSAQYSSVDPLQ